MISTLTISAQSFGGLLWDRDGMMTCDIYELSQLGFGFGSARSMALAGAFTSLGGDVASMGINPAGLGMYRTNELTFTPMMSFTRAKNSAQPFEGNSKNRFAVGCYIPQLIEFLTYPPGNHFTFSYL